MFLKQRLLKFILPGRIFEKVKNDTKQWLSECECGYKRDIWDTGGIRYKAMGEPRHKSKCPICGEITWHKIRKKSVEEKKTL